MNLIKKALAEPSVWAKGSWELATELKIIDGERPKNPVSREELVVILNRLGLLKK